MHKYQLLSQKQCEELKQYINEMSHAEHRQWIFSSCFYDKQLFFDTFFLHWQQHRGRKIPPSSLHYEIDEMYDNEDDQVLILPRGHAKTTRTLINIMHDLIYGVYKIGVPYDILYLSEKGLGAESIGKIRVELETNALLRDVYGPLTPIDEDTKKIQSNKNKKWKQSLLELVNGSSVETISKGGALRGKRKHKIIVDDPEENKDVRNKRVVEDFRDFILSAVYNMMLPGGKMMVIGTIVGELCLVLYLSKSMGWATLKRDAVENKKPIRPEMWSMEALRKRRSKIGSARFYQEFFHRPISRTDTIVKSHWIRFWDKLPQRFDKIIMRIDPATGEKQTNDETGVCILGVKKGITYEINTYGVRLSPAKLEGYLVDIYNKHKPTHVGYEKNIEKKLLHDLKQRGMPIKGYTQSRDKYSRLEDEAGEIEFGRAFFNKNSTELHHQLSHFPDVEHDDRMDAWMGANRLARDAKGSRGVTRVRAKQ